MQAELESDPLGVPVHLFGINNPDAESGNEGMVTGRRLPWLQDTVNVGVASLWDAKHFDLVILDGNNVPVMVHNLLEFDLTEQGNYQALMGMFRTLAAR